DSCRMEKAYRHWGHDISDEDTPLEAGLMFAVKMDKPGGFIGREALLAQKANPLTKRLLQFVLQNSEPLLYHNEPVWVDDKIVGRTTSGAFGHHVGAAIALGYVQKAAGIDEAYVANSKFEIEVAGTRFAASANLMPVYDPKSLRVRG
ncbi:MAG: glycine cleavage T C-terminal barrel domain-containing protein, partial [Hyphomicrobiaceae bacterium]